MADQEFYEIMKKKIEAANVPNASSASLNTRKQANIPEPTQKINSHNPKITNMNESNSYSNHSIPNQNQTPNYNPVPNHGPASSQTSIPQVALNQAGAPSSLMAHNIAPSEPILNQNIYPASINPEVSQHSNPTMINPNQSGIPMQPNGVKHYTTRSTVPPLQPTSSVLPSPQLHQDPVKPFQKTSSMNIPYNGNQVNQNQSQSQNVLMFNLLQLSFLGFMVLGMVFMSFFLGRWTNTSSEEKGALEKVSLKSSPFGVDVGDKKYTIRVTSMPRIPYDVGRLNLKRAIQIKQKLFEAGYKKVEINRNGNDLVVDVGRFTDPHEEALLLTVKKLKLFKIRDRQAFSNVYAIQSDG